MLQTQNLKQQVSTTPGDSVTTLVILALHINYRTIQNKRTDVQYEHRDTNQPQADMTT